MLILGSPFRFTSSAKMIDTISLLGLTSGLKLCLDAGDENSYTSGQKWLDVSGGGYDFYRGAGSSSEGSDPTFNGSVGGQSSSEYWSFDGGDYFTYDTSNETWMENFHKNNAVITIAAWVYMASIGNLQVIFGNNLTDALIGFGFCVNSTGLLRYVVTEGHAGTPSFVDGSLSVPTGQWSFVGLSLTEATGAGGAVFQVNGTQETVSSTYSSPSSSSATFTTAIGIAADPPPLYIRNGGRVADLSVWEGVALTAAELTSLYNATKGKFGL